MKFEIYKSMSGDLRIYDTYGLSEEIYLKLKKEGLPVYQGMSGSLNLRDSRIYTKEQILRISKLVEND